MQPGTQALHMHSNSRAVNDGFKLMVHISSIAYALQVPQLLNHLPYKSRSLHLVEEARLTCIFEFGHQRPKAEVPNKLLCLNRAQKHAAECHKSVN